MKLAWALQMGGSEKQFGDALRVYEIQAGSLDQEYLDGWAKRLGVEQLFGRLKARAELL